MEYEFEIYIFDMKNVSLLLQVAAWWLDDSPDSQVILLVILIHIFLGGTCYFMTATRKHPAIHCLLSLPPPPANHIHPVSCVSVQTAREPSGFNLDGAERCILAASLNAVKNGHWKITFESSRVLNRQSPISAIQLWPSDAFHRASSHRVTDFTFNVETISFADMSNVQDGWLKLKPQRSATAAGLEGVAAVEWLRIEGFRKDVEMGKNDAEDIWNVHLMRVNSTADVWLA